MGVYIPNMEKPKSCWGCRLMDGEANCLVTDEGISSKQEGIHPDCPLIEIPTPHGRLIDADLLKDTVRDSVPAYTIGVKIPTFGDTQIMSAIDVMPTILEAEGHDE